MSGGHTITRLPWATVLAMVVLLGAGLGGLARGDELYAGGSLMTRQIVWIVVGCGALVAATLVPYRRLRTWAYPLMFLCLILLALVLLGTPRNGSRSWFALGPMTFQPSEFAKLAYVLALSRYLMFARNHRSLSGLAVPFALTLPTIALILREPDLGTASVFLPVLFAMLFAAGARVRHLAVVVLLGAAALPILWSGLNAEQRSRITSTFRQVDGGLPRKGDEYHLHQSKQVLSLGAIWGSDLAGMPVAEAEAYHLPAARTDFVFCLIGERWGVWGAWGVLGAYLLLIGGALRVGMRTDEPFGRLLCVGVATWLGTQVIINSGMTVGLLPITGITLPLMSYGGSSLVSTCLAIGLVINVSLRPGYEVAGQPFAFSARPSFR
jgi:cell division protein FtsW (lipid II flippase)